MRSVSQPPTNTLTNTLTLPACVCVLSQTETLHMIHYIFTEYHPILPSSLPLYKRAPPPPPQEVLCQDLWIISLRSHTHTHIHTHTHTHIHTHPLLHSTALRQK